MFKIGLIVNPLAGLGGSVALKGSDNVAQLALDKGAVPKAGLRTQNALNVLKPYQTQISFLTCPGEMGEHCLSEVGFQFELLDGINGAETSADDTKMAAQKIKDQGVDILLFAGGDGTARDICSVIEDSLPVLGIPAGVKIHSAVYGVTPQASGEVIKLLIEGKLVDLKTQDVRDIDEEAFRNNQVKAKLFGEMRVPEAGHFVQSVKQGGIEHEELVLDDISAYIAQEMEPDTLYFVGSGKTTQAIMDYLHLPNTLLGVDAVFNEQLIQADVTEADILRLLSEHDRAKIIVSVIGGQGHIFGRGNQQFSALVLRKIKKDNIWVICTKTKLTQLNGEPLNVDTGDPDLDRDFSGSLEVITGYQDRVLYPVR